MSNKQDKIFSKLIDNVKDFAFSAEVANVFDDMVSRSVPIYEHVQISTLKMAIKHLKPGAHVYDLGCATGTTIELLASNINFDQIKFIGVDNSQAMLDACKLKLQNYSKKFDITLLNEDIKEAKTVDASLVILHFTLQFLPIEDRQRILNNIYENMLPGGILILSEKIKHRSPILEETIYQLHHDFKREKGYSELEISQKRDAIEKVLLPLTTEDNISMLRKAGFTEVEVFSKWYNFLSIVALK